MDLKPKVIKPYRTPRVTRQLLMIAVDGGVEKLRNEFFSFGVRHRTGKYIQDALIRSDYAWAIYWQYRKYDPTESVVIKFQTSGQKLALVLGPFFADDWHTYSVDFYNSSDDILFSKKINFPSTLIGNNHKFSSYRFQLQSCEKRGKQERWGESRLTMLPLDLKLKILDFVSGLELALLQCVCLEFRSLCDNDDLWKQKCIAERFKEKDVKNEKTWKQKFAKGFKYRSNREKSAVATFAMPGGRLLLTQNYEDFLLEVL